MIVMGQSVRIALNTVESATKKEAVNCEFLGNTDVITVDENNHIMLYSIKIDEREEKDEE